ncbi:MAG: cytochrome c [Myxococcota bacterium]
MLAAMTAMTGWGSRWGLALVLVACGRTFAPAEDGSPPDNAPHVAKAAVTRPVPAPEGPPDPLHGLPSDEREARLRELGEEAYAIEGAGRCAACHGPGGRGLRGAIPPLTGERPWLADCFAHAAIVLFGLHDPIVVDGLTYGGVMPPQAEQLDDLQVAAITTYVHGAWGNAGPVCSPDDVAVVRFQGPMSRMIEDQ